MRARVHILRELNDAVQRTARRLGRIVPVMAESDLNDRRVIDPVRQGRLRARGAMERRLPPLRAYAPHRGAERLLRGFRLPGAVGQGILRRLRVRRPALALPRTAPRNAEPRTSRPSASSSASRTTTRSGIEPTASGSPPWLTSNRRKLAATALLISPYVPLLFMGEEYGERAPFLFFTDFQDAELQRAVTRGRREEFADVRLDGRRAGSSEPDQFLPVEADLEPTGPNPARMALGLPPPAPRAAAPTPDLGGGRQATSARPP